MQDHMWVKQHYSKLQKSPTRMNIMRLVDVYGRYTTYMSLSVSTRNTEKDTKRDPLTRPIRYTSLNIRIYTKYTRCEKLCTKYI